MQTIYLDISNKGVIPCIMAKQSEVGRKFLAVITDNGVPYNIPDNALLSVWYEGNTDAGNYSSIEEKSAFSIDGNKVSVELVAQMLLKPGKGELCLSISHGDGGETNTWNIPYEVEYKPGAGSAVPTKYYTALTDSASRAAEQVGFARQYAEQAAESAKEAVEATDLKMSMDLLWENEDVTVAFPGQTININTNPYFMFAIETVQNTTQTNKLTDIVFIMNGYASRIKYHSVDGTVFITRYVVINQGNVRFDGSRKYKNGMEENDENLSVIPFRIWGIKQGGNV